MTASVIYVFHSLVQLASWIILKRTWYTPNCLEAGQDEPYYLKAQSLVSVPIL